jgi:hypothetical protein
MALELGGRPTTGIRKASHYLALQRVGLKHELPNFGNTILFRSDQVKSAPRREQTLQKRNEGGWVGGSGGNTRTSTCLRSASVTCMPSAPPAQDPAMSAPRCAASSSSSHVGTYGGLNTSTSTAFARRNVNGRASDARSGSSGVYMK